jgi:endonuclease/exonuclease/phosphatase family metal-dependent hydrolase
MTQGFQRVVFETQGQRIVLYNAHTAFPFMSIRAFGVQRDEEIRVLLARAEQETDAVILAGDFNLTDQAETYRQITARFADAHQEIGWGMGFTFPDYTETDSHLSWLPPLSRLDYVFHDAAFQAVEARVWPTSGGSDHRPVLVRLVLKSR